MPALSFWESVAIGILVLACMFLALGSVFDMHEPTGRKAAGLFAGAAGFLVAVFLMQNQPVLERYALEIVVALLGLLLVFIAFVRRGLQR